MTRSSPSPRPISPFNRLAEKSPARPTQFDVRKIWSSASRNFPRDSSQGRKESGPHRIGRHRQTVETATERWQTSSADLNRLLRLDPSALAVPMEPPHLQIDLIDLNRPLDDLIPVALTYRPELASQQALVQAALTRIRQEKMRPLVPSIVIRGAATNPAGTLAAGYFGGGVDGNMSNFGMRNSIDFQLLWEIQNLGFGNRAWSDRESLKINRQSFRCSRRKTESRAKSSKPTPRPFTLSND